MREETSKMAELKLIAPLAQFEETDESSISLMENEIDICSHGSYKKDLNYSICDKKDSNWQQQHCQVKSMRDAMLNAADNFTETFGGSLEDLVNTFDEKITQCFYNYQESVEKLAPVQVRSQEEIMNECQMWWTITGNYGNILPIDWSKSYSRKLHMPSLNLKENLKMERGASAKKEECEGELCSEDEAVANDLDMHTLILSGLNVETEPVKTADEVIREIDDIIQETDTPDYSSHSDSCPSEDTFLSDNCKQLLHGEKLQSLSVNQLNELYLELEMLIKQYSETLICELALRDELEFEKELKNSFISLLLAAQNKRRQYHVEKKKGIRNCSKMMVTEPKYLTTVIPYHVGNTPLDNQALQVLIKILKAINEDSPTVPSLLTDYILKVLCPT